MTYLSSFEDVTFKRVLPFAKVFARVSPKQKVELHDIVFHIISHDVIIYHMISW